MTRYPFVRAASGPRAGQMQRLSHLTSHARGLEAYQKSLVASPQLNHLFLDCGILAVFGVVFTGLAWWWMRLDSDLQQSLEH
jgi:hypothetical protein